MSPAGWVGQSAQQHQAVFNSDADPANTGAGLKLHHEFSAEAIFDLTIPLENQQEYGVRFIDGPAFPANAIAGLAVHRGTDGRLWVELTEREVGVGVGTIKVKGRIELTDALIDGVDQIKLTLWHDAGSDFATGSFELITGGVPSGDVVDVGGQAKIFNVTTAPEDQNFTRAGVYTTNFNIEENRATFVYEMDGFRVEKNGADIMVDGFGNGIAPGNPMGGANGIGYSTAGQFSEVKIEAGLDGNGILLMDSALANTVVIGGETVRVTNALALTDNTNATNGQGLKINDDFAIYGRFNLILPQEERSEYGIRFTDQTGAGTGDDVVSISVRMGTDGVVRVVLIDRNLVAGTMEILGSVELTPELLGTADQIGLGLFHDKTSPGAVTAGFRLFENGVELPGGPYPVPGVGYIFGKDTLTTADDEVWTRPQIFSTGFDLDGHAWIEGLETNDDLVGTAADEYFHGHAGNDRITGGGGTDTVYGGSGNDTVVLSGNVSDYTITAANNFITLVDNRGGSPDGTINARGVENFEFADATLASSLLLSPEIEVLGVGANVIDDGDTTPSATDGTAFGSVNLGDTLTQVFTINNLGGQTLTISNFKVPNGFTLVGPAPTSVPAGSSVTFEVAVNSSTTGSKSGKITFDTNDTTGGENKYDFAVSATVVTAPVPEVAVTGTGTQTNVNINDNDTTPALTDGTDFNNQEIGSTGLIRTFTIRNDGQADLVITNLAISGSGFIEGDGFTDVTLAPGATHEITVQLDTSSEGPKSAQITFNTNDPNEQDYNFAIKGNVTATPEIEVTGSGEVILDGDLTPSPDDDTAFGDVLLGTPESRTFAINNTGNGVLTISNLKLPAGFTLVNPAPTSIAAGGSADIEVQFSGTKLGLNTGQITFTTNDMTGGENAYNFAISANVVAPEVTVLGTGTKVNQNINDNDTSPSLVDGSDFGSSELDDAGTERTFTIRNDGTADLVISDLLVSGGFTLTDDLDNTTIAAGGSETFTVTLDTSVGGPQTGQITFTTNDLTGGEDAFNFAIKGNVTMTPEIEVEGNNTPILIGDPSPDVADDTDFGAAVLGSAPVIHTFTVNNTGNAPLTVQNIKVPAGFTLVQNITSPIPAGGSATFDVQLNTVKPGTFTGDILFVTNDPDEKAFKFKVTGAVTQPEIDVIGNLVSIKDNSKKAILGNHTDFGAGIGLDDTVTRTFTITNALGAADLTISSIALVGAGAASFTILDDLTGTVLAAGDSATFEVELDTTVAGKYAATIQINNNDANEGLYDFAILGTVGPRNIVGDFSVNPFEATGDPENITGTGGPGDTVSYANATGPTGVIASLLSPKGNTGFAAGDLYTSIENLIGTDFNDKLTGDKNNNVLEGGEGADTLDGGAGIDTASYAGAGNFVVASLLKPSDNQGDAAGDVYKAIENLLGSNHNDKLIGNKSNNAIDGGDGDDEITGGGGKDTLTGGANADTFVYNLANEGGDTITDFSTGEDKLQFKKSAFKINAVDDVDFATNYFVEGTVVTEGNAQFLFNATDSTLWWDADGTGKAKAVLIATLSGVTDLTANDFVLVA